MKKNDLFYLKDSLLKTFPKKFDEENANLSNNLLEYKTESTTNSTNTKSDSKSFINPTTTKLSTKLTTVEFTSTTTTTTNTTNTTHLPTKEPDYTRDTNSNLQLCRKFESQRLINSETSRKSSTNFSYLKRIYNKKKPLPTNLNDMNQEIKVDINNNGLVENKNVNNQNKDFYNVVTNYTDNNNNNKIDNINYNSNNNYININNNKDEDTKNGNGNNDKYKNNDKINIIKCTDINNNNNNDIDNNNSNNNNNNRNSDNSNRDNNNKNNINNNNNIISNNRCEVKSVVSRKVAEDSIHSTPNHDIIDNFHHDSVFTFRKKDKEEDDDDDDSSDDDGGDGDDFSNEEDGGNDNNESKFNNYIFADEDSNDDVEKDSRKSEKRLEETSIDISKCQRMQEEIKKWRRENEKLKRKYVKIKQQCLLNLIKVDSGSEEEDLMTSHGGDYDWCYKILFETCLKKLCLMEGVSDHGNDQKNKHVNITDRNTNTNDDEAKSCSSVDNPVRHRKTSSCPDLQKFAQISLLQLNKTSQNANKQQIESNSKALNLPDKSSFSRQSVQYRHIKPRKNLAERYSAEGIKNSHSFLSLCHNDLQQHPMETSTPRTHRRLQKQQVKSNYERLCTRRNGLGSLRLKDKNTSIINRLSAQNFTSYINKT